MNRVTLWLILVLAIVVSCSQATSPNTNNPPKSYKIGDTGPAGGIIFYDQRSVANGWRYMECAPTDLTSIQWGASTQTGATDGMGVGKSNTATIVGVLGTTGASYAALECQSLTQNGYSDWFLPSSSELMKVFQNLSWNGEGGLTAGSNYWTSSENGISSEAEYGYWTAGSDQFGAQSKAAAYRVRPIREFAP